MIILLGGCTNNDEAYGFGCAAGIATRDRPIEIWTPEEIDINGSDDTKANPAFIEGYYDCR